MPYIIVVLTSKDGNTTDEVRVKLDFRGRKSHLEEICKYVVSNERLSQIR